MKTVGVDIGATNIKSVLIGDDGTELNRTTIPTLADQGPNEVIRKVQRVISELTRGFSNDEIRGIGIGAPGSVDFRRGLLLYPPNLIGWKEVPLVSIIHQHFGYDVRLENDANCAALGERSFGAGRTYKNFIGLTLGTGVGSGIILDGKIYHGSKGYAGEFGHMSINYSGLLCKCGSRGCIEAYVGSAAIAQRAWARISRTPESLLYKQGYGAVTDLTPQMIAEAAAAHDATSRRVLYETGEYLGVAIASVANLFDVTVFIIGGGVAGAGEFLFEGIQKKAREMVLQVHKEHLTIIPAELGNDAGMFGAAALFDCE